MSNIKKLKSELSEIEAAKKKSNEILNEIQYLSENKTNDNLNECKDFSENHTNENLNEVQYYPEEQKENEEYYFSENQIYIKNNYIENLNMDKKRIIPIYKANSGKDDIHLENHLSKYASDDVLEGKRNIVSDRVKYTNYKISLPENQPNKRVLYKPANVSNHNPNENKDNLSQSEIDNNLNSTVSINNGYILEPNCINKLSQSDFNDNINIYESTHIKNNICSSENIITTNTNTINIPEPNDINNNNKNLFYFNNKQEEQILEKEYAVNNELNNKDLNCHPIANEKVDNETNKKIITNTGLNDSFESDDSCHCHCHCNCRGCCEGCDCDDFYHYCCIGCCEGCAKACCIIF